MHLGAFAFEVLLFFRAAKPHGEGGDRDMLRDEQREEETSPAYVRPWG
jgi:hypothetical protein